MSWYGDSSPAVANLNATMAWMRLLAALSEGGSQGLPDSTSLGDCNWAGDTENVPEGLATAWLTWNGVLLERVFDAIGKEDSADDARALAAAAASAYGKFVDERGKVSSGSQMAQAVALWFGLVRDVGVAKLAAVLLGQQIDEAGVHVHGGIFTMKAIAAVSARCVACIMRVHCHASHVTRHTSHVTRLIQSWPWSERCRTCECQWLPRLQVPLLLLLLLLLLTVYKGS